MKVLEFRKIRNSDKCVPKYSAWSRIYEYQLVMDMISKHIEVADPSIHNTSWGFEGCHVIFKNDLDLFSNKCIHSDIKESSLPKTEIWDITKSPKDNWKNSFDVVVNVSTLEEVNFDHLKIFDNLLDQVKPGGLLICTFDLPGLDLDKFENKFNLKIERFSDELNNHNSKIPAFPKRNLECGIMVIKK